MFKMLVRCGIAALLAVLGSGATAQDPKKPIYVGQVSPLTGPASSVGVPLTRGASLLVRKVNANGGINGSTLKLLDKDDGFDPKRTVGAVTELLADKERPIVALINVVGSSQNGDLVSQGLLASNDLNIVGAFTGSTSVRALKSPHLYFVRPGVEDEANHIIAHFIALGIDRVALVHPEDTFGRDALAKVTQALASRKLTLVGAGTYQPATTDVKGAVATMLERKPQAIAIFATGAAAAKFITSYREQGGGAMLTTSSSTSADHLLKALPKELSRGVGILQVVPPTYKVALPLVSEYLEALRVHGDPGWAPSAYGLEGFLAAKVLIAAIRRVPGTPTRASVSSALASQGTLDLGGIRLDFSKARREGARYLEIGVLSSDGKLRN
ncbi:ABC transporter substrate-binding protein [Hydrogenophaga sp.]|uniref:ABC transporter substrate-binding protein n=1 Tax=Hydrogenophaga sp. TaxID=1904254 RepID=UPI00262C542E|nr:ABC transporter substrate-binding protein [Hydrogenophaga sp.]MDM7950548.1 ABC transporter substrate-binding protein [Hydrogenophaga sp.]